jgi:hypothetical protein
MQLHGFGRNAQVYLDDKSIGAVGLRGVFSSIPIGTHEIRVVDKNNETYKMPRSFASGELVKLAKKDFPLPLKPPSNSPPPNTGEPDLWPQVAKSGSIDQLEQYRAQHPNSPHLGDLEAQLDDLYWEKAVGTGTAAGFEEYLGKVRSGKHRSDAQQELAWSKAAANNTIPDLRNYQQQYPQGPHFGAASKKIEDLKRAEEQIKEDRRFQEARNSTDDTILQAFLKDYPTGVHHDQIYGRRDELLWERTSQSDKGSLQAYVARMPEGKYVGQANDAIEKLTEAAKSPKQPAKPVVDDKNEVLKIVAQYNQAYNDRNVDALRKIWPTMDHKRIASTRDFFKTASSVTSTYKIDQEPQINGDEAIVRWTLTFSYVVNGKEENQRPSGVIMTLKKHQSASSAAVWEIQSVSGR